MTVNMQSSPQKCMSELLLMMMSQKCLMRPTSEARGPGYVQVEVLRCIYEHIKISVWLRRERGNKEYRDIVKVFVSIESRPERLLKH